MAELYPPIEPYDQGILDVGEGNLVYWEACGNLGRQTRRRGARRAGVGMHDRHSPVLRPGPVPGRPLRSARPVCWHSSESARTTSPTAPGSRKAPLLRDAERLAGIPGVLIHGRLDLGGPVHTAWALARAWLDAELAVINDFGHTGSDTMREQVRSAFDKFA